MVESKWQPCRFIFLDNLIDRLLHYFILLFFDRRTVHGVPEDQIERMLNRYEKNLTVAIVTNKTKKPVTNGLADSQIK